jgi:hypothetical protein
MYFSPVFYFQSFCHFFHNVKFLICSSMHYVVVIVDKYVSHTISSVSKWS